MARSNQTTHATAIFDLSLALEAYSARRFQEAERICRNICAQDPPPIEAMHLLGLIEMAQGRLEAAIETLTVVTECQPDDATAWNNLGIALRKHGRLLEAIAAFENAVAYRPTYPDALYNLAVALTDTGKRGSAIEPLHRCLSHAPGHAGARFLLGDLLADAGNHEEATAHLERYLRENPGDVDGARMRLAQMNRGPVPSRASTAQLDQLYSSKAHNWDRADGYLAHRHVGDAIARLLPGHGNRILDIGCGTGLVGGLLRDRAAQLVGIDLSEAMLSVARQKSLYDTLIRDDLASFLSVTALRFDAVAAAAVLIHFGDLATIFSSVANILEPGGLFVFTVYPNDKGDPRGFGPCINPELAKSGCFSHHKEYIKSVAQRSGFELLEFAKVAHEFRYSHTEIGLLVALRLTASS
ncbi:tetratricopeptide repeat protein [Rhizobium sp. L1K21]|uniref:tetratricopeptide repeat protein n=1 Tax=Rhizobium sp. L1K21 TaxID=2954933 RepID=UPI002092AF85|nr:tetratricopeptide repeat protein [Rhizobium sp. L1K21]MCO6187306.1 tetratricopeptide repeat protein [Rhizobium sp. L1K21]